MTRKPFHFYTVMACALMATAACSGDNDGQEGTTVPPIQDGGSSISIKEPAGGFRVERCRVLTVKPTMTGNNRYGITWLAGNDVVANADSLEFIAYKAGTYDITMLAKNTAGVATTARFTITVVPEGVPYSPYIASVTDYRPAPGQFVNELPEYSEGDTQADMNRKALESIGNNARGMITLGGYGGYVVCGFDHTIVNTPGQRDFKVLGNAFYADANPNPDAPAEGGSCEPGIVMVAFDRNRNGRPDSDEWYELAGSEHGKPTTKAGYEITYHRPAPDHEAVAGGPDEPWNTDAEYIRWADNTGAEGYVYKNNFHSQDYYPRWISDNTMTFKGTLLPNNATDESGTGSYWVLYAFGWGYADNRLNSEDGSTFDIGWAVDARGNKVNLPGIDFIKIYTGVNQYCGWLGETSTEVMGATDLHLAE